LYKPCQISSLISDAYHACKLWPRGGGAKCPAVGRRSKWGDKARRQFEEGGPHLLSFSSEAKRYQEQSADLAIGVGWPGFGAGLKASVLFRYESVGILLLQKSLVDQSSRIFAGPDGSLAVRPGEAFIGRCSYETTAISQHNGGLKLASFGKRAGDD